MRTPRIPSSVGRALARVLVIATLALGAAPAEARPGGRPPPPSRGSTRTNLGGGGYHRPPPNRHPSGNVNVNHNVNHNVNVNVNRNYGGGYYGGYGRPPPPYYGRPYYGPRPGAVVAATVATALVVGAVVASLPPNCSTTVVNGVAFNNCGGTYYQPQYNNGNVTYVVVNPP